MKATKFVYESELPYVYVTRKEKTDSVVKICGVNDLIYIWTTCGGKTYEKLKRVRQLKSKTADEVLSKEIAKEISKMKEWLRSRSWTGFDGVEHFEGVNGADFDKHGIKTNQEYDGYTLGGYFERVLENPEVFGYEVA